MKTKSDYIVCPKCDVRLDNTECIDVENAPPKRGDISICAYCGTVSRFEGQEEYELELIQLKEEDLFSLREKHPSVYKIIIDAVKEIKGSW